MTKKELFGYFDESGSEFIDGIFVRFLRQCNYMVEENQKKEN